MSLSDGIIEQDLQSYYRALLEEAGEKEVFITKSGSFSGCEALKICESPYNRKTSVEKRKNVAFAFECGDHKAFLKAINAFFDESIKDFTFDR